MYFTSDSEKREGAPAPSPVSPVPPSMTFGKQANFQMRSRSKFRAFLSNVGIVIKIQKPRKLFELTQNWILTRYQIIKEQLIIICF